MILYWRLMRLLVCFVLPRFRFEVSWPIKILPDICGRIRRGWYRCNWCGQRWNCMAVGARYRPERVEGKIRLVGLCSVCRKAAKL